MIKGVLLDIDGTLVLSNDAHAWSWVKVLKRFGFIVSYDAVRPLIGMGGDKLLPKVVPGLKSSSDIGKKISQQREQLFLSDYVDDLRPALGSRDLLMKLNYSGLKYVAASSASSKTLKVLLQAAQVDDLLTQATTSDDADSSKPDPDIIHAALSNIDLSPTEVIMVGDTPYDIKAAQSAGVQTIALRCGGWQDEDLDKAIAIYNDPRDLVSNYESSPFHK